MKILILVAFSVVGLFVGQTLLSILYRKPLIERCKDNAIAEYGNHVARTIQFEKLNGQASNMSGHHAEKRNVNLKIFNNSTFLSQKKFSQLDLKKVLKCDILSSCSLPHDAKFDVRATKEEIMSMYDFMDDALSKTEKWHGKYGETAERIFQWRQENLFRVPLHTSAVYLFSGMDMVTLAGMQPFAHSHTLLAEFKRGDFNIFTEETCRSAALESAVSWMGHVFLRDFLFSNTNEMRDFFSKSCERGDIGILPALLLNARLLGHQVIDATQRGSLVTLYTQVRHGSNWRCGKISYIGGNMIEGPDDLTESVLGVPPPWFVLVKAGPHDLMRRQWFADLIVAKSATIVQDESGPLPKHLKERGMDVVPYGDFKDFVSGQSGMYDDDAKEIHLFFNRSAPVASLPFCFGYCEHSNAGTLLASLRKDFLLPENEEPKLWLVLATQRSGSSWFSSLIAQHPDVHFDPKEESLIEWTSALRRKNPSGDWSKTAFQQKIEDIWLRLSAVDSSVVGFKLMEDQIAYPDVLRDFLREKSAGFVHLERRHSILQLVSSIQSTEEKTYHIHDSKQQISTKSNPVELTPEHSIRWVEATKERHGRMKLWADAWATDGLHIFYEDLVENPPGVLADVFQTMGLDPGAALIRNHHGIQNFFQVHKESCEERLANPDEIFQALQGTPSACCFANK